MKVHDESIEQLIVMAIDAIYEGDCVHGRGLLESALYDEPGYPKLHSTLGWMYQYHQIDETKAERHYRLAIHFDENYVYPYEMLVDLYLTQRNYGLLESLMKSALRAQEVEKEFAYQTLGKVKERQGIFKEAIDCYRKALLNCMDNDDLQELRKNIKRVKFKRLKNRLRKWQVQN